MCLGIQCLLADINPCDRERVSYDTYRKQNSSVETLAFRTEPLQPVNGGQAGHWIADFRQRIRLNGVFNPQSQTRNPQLLLPPFCLGDLPAPRLWQAGELERLPRELHKILVPEHNHAHGRNRQLPPSALIWPRISSTTSRQLEACRVFPIPDLLSRRV